MSGFDRRPPGADMVPDCEYVVLLPDGTLSSKARSENAAQVTAIAEIWGERLRQVVGECWVPEIDDLHDYAELARFAAAHALASAALAPAMADNPNRRVLAENSRFMPPAGFELKHTTARRHLVIAAALLLAELERLDRAERLAGAEAMGAL